MARQPAAKSDDTQWPGESLMAAPAPNGPAAGGFPSVAPHPAPDGSGAMTNLSDADYWRFIGRALPPVGPSEQPPITPAPPDPNAPAWPGEQLTAPETPPPENPWAQRLTAFLQGATSTPGLIADVALAPSNLLMSGVNALAGRELARPVADSRERTGDVLEAVGLPRDYTPSLDTRIAEGVGAAVGPYSLLAPFKAATRAVGETVPLIGRGAFSLASRPGTQIAAGAAAGAGQSVVDQTESPGVRLAVPLATGLLGAAAAGGVGNVFSSLLRTPRALNSSVVRTMGQSAADPTAAFKSLLADAPPTDELGAYRTTAEATGDPGLFGLERTLRDAGRASESAAFVQHDAQRQQARTAILDTIADPNAAKVADLGNEMAQRRVAAQQAVDQARAGLGPGLLPQQAGDVLQARGTALRVPSGQNVQAEMDAVDPSNTTRIGTRELRRAMNESADREYYNNVAARDPEIGQMLESLAPGPVTFQQLQRMRSVSVRKSQGIAASANPQLAAFHRDTAEAIRQTIHDAAANGRGMAPEQAAQWDVARRAAEEHGRRFGSDYALDLTGQTYGRYDEGAGSIADQHWRPGGAGADAVRAFKATFADPRTGVIDPAALRALRGHIAGQIGGLVDPETGQIERAALTRYLSNHRAAIRELPQDMQNQLSTLQRATRLAQREGAIPSSRAETRANAAALFLDRNADLAVRQALDSDNSTALVRDLHDRVKNSPAALAGLKRAYLEYFADRITSTTALLGAEMKQLPSAAHRFWRAHEDSARIIFSPEELRRLERVHDDFLSGSQWSSVGRASGSPTAQLLANDPNRISNGALIAAVLAGVSLPPQLHPLATQAAAALRQRGGIAAPGSKAMAALYDTALDPRAAADLLRRADPLVLDRAIGRLQFRNGLPVPDIARIAGRSVPALSVESSRARGTQP